MATGCGSAPSPGVVRLDDRHDGDQDRVHAGHEHGHTVDTVDNVGNAHGADEYHDVDDNEGARVI